MRGLVATSLIMLAFAGCGQSGKKAGSVVGGASDRGTAETAESVMKEGHRASSAEDPVTEQKNPTDEEITEKIRTRLTESKIGTNLGNVKISTQDGKVTIRGLVKTAEEKQIVEEVAQDVAGDKEVDSQLEVE